MSPMPPPFKRSYALDVLCVSTGCSALVPQNESVSGVHCAMSKCQKPQNQLSTKPIIYQVESYQKKGSVFRKLKPSPIKWCRSQIKYFNSLWNWKLNIKHSNTCQNLICNFSSWNKGSCCFHGLRPNLWFGAKTTGMADPTWPSRTLCHQYKCQTN